MLRIENLSVAVNTIPLLHDVSLSLEDGQTHAIMGPNGSGKSTLASSIMKHPAYTIISGSILFNGVDITTASTDVRARAGIFLVFQNPYAIPGVRIFALLKEACRAMRGVDFVLPEFVEEVHQYCALLAIDPALLERSINDGFSGGEKKKFELLQMLVCKPTLAILDEIDSGLDIDALACIGRAVAYARQRNPMLSIMLITHYQRILEYIVPDHVHILCDGRFVRSGDSSLVRAIEAEGYDAYRI
jgi:Fe-S cluster assembly ATP-binding protein